MLRRVRISVVSTTRGPTDLECCALKCRRLAIDFCKIKAAITLEPSREVTGKFLVLRVTLTLGMKLSDDALP